MLRIDLSRRQNFENKHDEPTNCKTNRQTDRQTHKQADRQTDKRMSMVFGLSEGSLQRRSTVAAMKREEEKKEAKYNSKLLPEGDPAHWSFLLFANIWPLGEQAVRYLNKLAKVQEMMKENKMKPTSRTSGHHCNAKVISYKLIRTARLESRNVVCSVQFCMLQDCNGPVVLVLGCS